MPSVITDAMVKEQCSMSRPIPMKAIEMLNPNSKVGSKPSYVKNRGRSGIRYTEQPVYAPASVNSLVQSICNITKLEEEVVENYLENRIQDEVVVFNAQGDGGGGGGGVIELVNPEEVVFDPYDIPDVPLDIVELEDRGSLTRGAGRPPADEGRVMDAEPTRFQSAGAEEVGDPAGMVSVGELSTDRPRGRPRDENIIIASPRGSSNLRGSYDDEEL